jgi:hypothetical protein
MHRQRYMQRRRGQLGERRSGRHGTGLHDDTDKLPPGIPDWAIGPLLTAGAIILYLIIRNLITGHGDTKESQP